MSTESKSKHMGSVLGAYAAYLAFFGMFAGGAAYACDLYGPILNLSLLYVSATFGFVYRYRDAIRRSISKSLLVYGLSVGLTLLPLKWILDIYFSRVLALEFLATGVTFAYVCGYKRKIESSPWQYVFPLFLVFLFVLLALMVML